MKTVIVRMVITMPDESYNSEEFAEFKNSINSGEMQRDMVHEKNRFKIAKCKITLLDVK